MAITRRTKKPSEVRRYSMDFSAYEELANDGDTLTGSPTVTSTPSGLTTASPSVSGNFARFTASSGTLGEVYEVSVVVNTTAGFTLQGYGEILIAKDS